MSYYLLNVLASRDLEKIAEDFKLINLESGERFFYEFKRKCQLIVASPHDGKSYAEIRPNIRGLSFERYIIFYRSLDYGVEILRVLSISRDL